MAGKKWTEEEILYIKNNFEKISTEEIAKNIGRTKKAVWHLYEKLNLKKRGVRVGDIFNRLEVMSVRMVTKHDQNAKRCSCKCICGNMIDVWATCLLSNMTKSCGCLKNEKASQRMTEMSTTHGLSNHRLYRQWNNMRRRCYDPKSISYHNYGAKGIVICDEWKNDFELFYKWAMDNGYQDGLSLDRINGSLGYSPENCRWATSEEQNNNRSNNVKITAFGETKNLEQWARDPRCRAKPFTIQYRLNQGYSPEEAISTPKYNSYKKKAKS